MSTITITIKGPQGSGKTTIAAAIREMFLESGYSDVRVISPGEPEGVDKAIEALYYLRPRPRVEIVTEAAPATRSYAVGDRVRIVGGEHDGRLGVIIETDLGDLALRVDAEDGEVVTRAFAIGGGRGGGGAFTIGNGGGNGGGGGGGGQVGGGTTISIGDRKLVARGGRGGFVASLADFDLEPAGGQ